MCASLARIAERHISNCYYLEFKMSIDPHQLQYDLDRLEEIEKATLRMVTQAIFDFRQEAAEIFGLEKDLVGDIGEDLTREALDRMGTSRLRIRLIGKIDYKQARYLFHPAYSIRQALFVDSKAETMADDRTATIQTTQTSLQIRFVNKSIEVDEEGQLAPIIDREGISFLTTNIFVKYGYHTVPANQLASIKVIALPNGLLQNRYNPNAYDTT